MMSSSNESQPRGVQLCYENINGSCIKTSYSPGPRVILYLAFGSAVLLAVLGNLLVMISILHFKQLYSPANFLIASLACADFLVGTTVMPFSMVRYIAVTDPLVYPTKFTLSVSGICITFSWFLAITFSFSLLYTGVNDDGLEELVSALTCVGGCQIAVNQTWVLIDFLLFFIPTLVMVILYCKIFLVAKQQARKIESMNSKTESSSESYKARVSKRERKAAKTLGIAVIAFLISWFPYFIESIIDAFLGFITPTYIYEILVWFAYYNSAMNPLIYAFFYPWFRRAIKLILTGKVFRGHSSTIDLFSEQVKVLD